MDEKGLITKIIEHFGKLMSRYTRDELVFGSGYIEFTDRKIEIVEPDKVICDKDGWKVVLDTIDKKKILKALSKIHLKRRDEDYLQFQERIKTSIKKELGLEDELFGMKVKEDKNLKGNEFRLE